MPTRENGQVRFTTSLRRPRRSTTPLISAAIIIVIFGRASNLICAESPSNISDCSDAIVKLWRQNHQETHVAIQNGKTIEFIVGGRIGFEPGDAVQAADKRLKSLIVEQLDAILGSDLSLKYLNDMTLKAVLDDSLVESSLEEQPRAYGIAYWQLFHYNVPRSRIEQLANSIRENERRLTKRATLFTLGFLASLCAGVVAAVSCDRIWQGYRPNAALAAGWLTAVMGAAASFLFL